MAYESDSLNQRTIGPAIAAAVVGIVIGVAAVIGIAQVSGQDQLPEDTATAADASQDALLGGTEYGARPTEVQ